MAIYGIDVAISNVNVLVHSFLQYMFLTPSKKQKFFFTLGSESSRTFSLPGAKGPYIVLYLCNNQLAYKTKDEKTRPLNHTRFVRQQGTLIKWWSTPSLLLVLVTVTIHWWCDTNRLDNRRCSTNQRVACCTKNMGECLGLELGLGFLLMYITGFLIIIIVQLYWNGLLP